MPADILNPVSAPALPRRAIAIIDSDEMVSALLESNLNADYDVDIYATAEAALDADLRRYALVILDIDLRGPMSGMEFAMELHGMEASAGVPLIFCTARDSEDDIIRGFDAGADDYVVKPFSLREMMARVRSVIRRHTLTRQRMAQSAVPSPAVGRPAPCLEVEGLKISFENQKVEVDGSPVALSRTEFMILALLARQPGVAYTREEIHRRVWDDAGPDAGSSRAVDVNISRLRKKLGARASHITNRPGLGYTFS